jgi:hypothetical protein
MKNIYTKISLFVLSLFLVFVAFRVYSSVTNNQITACVNRDGGIRIITGNKTCTNKENILSWNMIGPKGDTGTQGPVGLTGATSTIAGPVGPQGPVGPKGDSATNGAGNVAFYFNFGGTNFALRKDGTVWSYQHDTNSWNQNPNITVPIPTENIISWEVYDFMDKDGNIWGFYDGYTPIAPWVNGGHP